MSVYGCFQSAHFPSITIGQHCDTFRRPSAQENSFSVLDGSVSIKSARVHVPSVSFYIPGKSENVTTTKRPRFHLSDSCACSSLPLKIIGFVAPLRPGCRMLKHWKRSHSSSGIMKKTKRNGTELVKRLFIFIYLPRARRTRCISMGH